MHDRLYNKVFLVRSGSLSHPCVEGVFSSQEKAQHYISNRAGNYPDSHYSIRSYELDLPETEPEE